MRVAQHVVEARREKLAALIDRHRYLPIGELCQRLGVSEATARRDLAALVKRKVITRTHGGALAEFNERFPSFNERQRAGHRAKQAVARNALRFIEPGGVYFFDSGTTIFALAEEFRAAPVPPVSVVTSNIPAAELLSAIPGVSVFLLAGQIFNRQSVVLGKAACRSVEFWNYDIAFLSAEAANRDGIWNSQEAIVELQLVAIRQSARSIFCLDHQKIGSSAPHFLRSWGEGDWILTDAAEATLEAEGIPAGHILTPPKTEPLGRFSGSRESHR